MILRVILLSTMLDAPSAWLLTSQAVYSPLPTPLSMLPCLKVRHRVPQILTKHPTATRGVCAWTTKTDHSGGYCTAQTVLCVVWYVAKLRLTALLHHCNCKGCAYEMRYKELLISLCCILSCQSRIRALAFSCLYLPISLLIRGCKILRLCLCPKATM